MFVSEKQSKSKMDILGEGKVEGKKFKETKKREEREWRSLTLQSKEA